MISAIWPSYAPVLNWFHCILVLLQRLAGFWLESHAWILYLLGHSAHPSRRLHADVQMPVERDAVVAPRSLRRHVPQAHVLGDLLGGSLQRIAETAPPPPPHDVHAPGLELQREQSSASS